MLVFVAILTLRMYGYVAPACEGGRRSPHGGWCISGRHSFIGRYTLHLRRASLCRPTSCRWHCPGISHRLGRSGRVLAPRPRVQGRTHVAQRDGRRALGHGEIELFARGRLHGQHLGRGAGGRLDGGALEGQGADGSLQPRNPLAGAPEDVARAITGGEQLVDVLAERVDRREGLGSETCGLGARSAFQRLDLLGDPGERLLEPAVLLDADLQLDVQACYGLGPLDVQCGGGGGWGDRTTH